MTTSKLILTTLLAIFKRMVYVVLISVHVLLDSILIVLVLKLNLLSHVNRLSKQVYIFEVTAVPYMIRETRLLKVLFIHVTLR